MPLKFATANNTPTIHWSPLWSPGNLLLTVNQQQKKMLLLFRLLIELVNFLTRRYTIRTHVYRTLVFRFLIYPQFLNIPPKLWFVKLLTDSPGGATIYSVVEITSPTGLFQFQSINFISCFTSFCLIPLSGSKTHTSQLQMQQLNKSLIFL